MVGKPRPCEPNPTFLLVVFEHSSVNLISRGIGVFFLYDIVLGIGR
jgi:hypothetical protein